MKPNDIYKYNASLDENNTTDVACMDMLREYLAVLIIDYRTFKELLASMPAIKLNLKDLKVAEIRCYGTYLSALPLVHRKLEMAKPLSSISVAVSAMIKTLEDLQKHPTIAEGKTLSTKNMKASHVISFDTITVLSVYLQTVKYVTAVAMSASLNTPVLPFVMDYVAQHAERIVRWVSTSVATNSSLVNVPTIIKKLQMAGANVYLYDEQGRANLPEDLISRAGLEARPFFVISSVIDMIKSYRINKVNRAKLKREKMKADYDWMNAQVALLQAKANGVEENSNAYKNYCKVIDKYEARIAILKRKMEKYEQR